MRGLASALAIAVCLTTMAGLPAAGAHGPDPQAVYKFTEPGEAKGWSNVTLETEPSQQLLDRFDDGDEQITADEASNIETFLADRARQASPKTAWDGQAPASSEVLDVTLTDAEGPVEEDERLHVHSRSRISYPSEDAVQDHVWSRLTGGADEDRHLKIKAPHGFEAEPRQGLESVETDGAWIEGTTSSEEDVAVTFAAEETQPADTPLSLAATVLAGLAAALIVSRRST